MVLIVDVYAPARNCDRVQFGFDLANGGKFPLNRSVGTVSSTAEPAVSSQRELCASGLGVVR